MLPLRTNGNSRAGHVALKFASLEEREKMHFRNIPARGKLSVSPRILIAAAVGLAGLGGLPSARADLGGFSGFTLNGGATSDGATLTLTDGGGSEARSAFNNAVQNVTSFTTSFT